MSEGAVSAETVTRILVVDDDPETARLLRAFGATTIAVDPCLDGRCDDSERYVASTSHECLLFLLVTV